MFKESDKVKTFREKRRKHWKGLEDQKKEEEEGSMYMPGVNGTNNSQGPLSEQKKLSQWQTVFQYSLNILH